MASTHYLWRAVDHEGEVLESFVTKRRDRKAALKFLRKTMKRHGSPHILVTDKLRSYWCGDEGQSAARTNRKLGAGSTIGPRIHTSHFRRRERAMLRFRRMRTLQRFVAVHASSPQPFQSGSKPLSSAITFQGSTAPPLSPSGAASARPKRAGALAGILRRARIRLTAPLKH